MAGDPSSSFWETIQGLLVPITTALGTLGLILSPFGKGLREIVGRSDRIRDKDAADRLTRDAARESRIDAATKDTLDRRDAEIKRLNEEIVQWREYAQKQTTEWRALVNEKDEEIERERVGCEIWRRKAWGFYFFYLERRAVFTNTLGDANMRLIVCKQKGIDPVPFPTPTMDNILDYKPFTNGKEKDT